MLKLLFLLFLPLTSVLANENIIIGDSLCTFIDNASLKSNRLSPKGDLAGTYLWYGGTTLTWLKNALNKLTSEQLLDPMPDTPPQHKGRSIQFFLIQLSCHLSRHTGQLNYLRRILENK